MIGGRWLVAQDCFPPYHDIVSNHKGISKPTTNPPSKPNNSIHQRLLGFMLDGYNREREFFHLKERKGPNEPLPTQFNTYTARFETTKGYKDTIVRDNSNTLDG